MYIDTDVYLFTQPDLVFLDIYMARKTQRQTDTYRQRQTDKMRKDKARQYTKNEWFVVECVTMCPQAP